MPRYEYTCESCGYTTTVKRAIADRDRLAPVCQHGEADHPAAHPMKRSLGAGGFELKGSGWAKDGYAGQ